MRIRAKFECWGAVKTDYGEQVELHAVTADSEANRSWSEATPSGSLTMTITNHAAQGQFEAGKEYFLDITPVAGGD